MGTWGEGVERGGAVTRDSDGVGAVEKGRWRGGGGEGAGVFSSGCARSGECGVGGLNTVGLVGRAR